MPINILIKKITNIKPPYINTNDDNFMIWSGYEDYFYNSGINSLGTDGQIGATGKRGPIGKKGKKGKTITITQYLDSIDDLPPASEDEENNSYIIEIDNRKHLFTVEQDEYTNYYWKDNGEILNVVDIRGYIGEQGTAGEQGEVGLTGANGYQGIAGKVGKQGAIGVKGQMGDMGQAGAVGAVGPKGIGQHGATGPTGIAGLDGTGGPTGPQGPQGPQGPTGKTARAGPQGPQGKNGSNGNHGNNYQLINTFNYLSNYCNVILNNNFNDETKKFMVVDNAGNSSSPTHYLKIGYDDTNKEIWEIVHTTSKPYTIKVVDK
jgi:hypothetical protein